MLCTPDCPGAVCGSLGASIWGVRGRTAPAPAAIAAGGRGELTAAGLPTGCGVDCIIVAVAVVVVVGGGGGGSALMMCEPALTAVEPDVWPSFAPTPAGVPATAGLAALFPFKVASEPAVCIGGLTSVTVGPVAWFTGWAEATTPVWMTPLEGLVPLDSPAPLLLTAGLLL